MISCDKNILHENLGSGTTIFFHIPKTAGTTLNTIFKRIFGKENTIVLNGERLDSYTKLPDNQKANFKVIGGHMPFGYHKIHPVPCSYFTFFRDPLKRAISGYKHILTHPSRELHLPYHENDVSLEQHLLDPRFDNFQIKRVLFDTETPLPEVELNEKTAEFALERLSSCFAFSGLQEYFDESLLILSKMYNWPDPVYQRRNVSPLNRKKYKYSKDVAKEFIERNKYDYMIYNQVKEALEELIQQLGPSFQEEVKKFKSRLK